MTIESSHLQKPTSAPDNSVMNVQDEIRKSVQNTSNANDATNTTKQVLAATQIPQQQNLQNKVAEQLNEGYLDIKI